MGPDIAILRIGRFFDDFDLSFCKMDKENRVGCGINTSKLLVDW